MTEKTIIDESQSRLIEATRRQAERPVLILLEGGDPKDRYRLAQREFTIGRDLGCDLVLSDSKASRTHARLHYENFDEAGDPPRVSLTDLESTNGTFVNGKKIDKVELRDRDKIMIGSTLFGFFLHDETTVRADESLIHLASFDALTGLRNRGVFDLDLVREFERARRYRRPLSLIMFDIDHFKLFNDDHGHPVGDRVLREIGALVNAGCRRNDLAARYGGEEFAVLLPETTLEHALVQGERLRRAVVGHSVSGCGQQPLSITVSVGLAELEPDMKEPRELVEAADRALYQAKQAGRNRVCWSRPTPVPHLETATPPPED